MIKEGYVEKVIYKNDANGYAVFTVSGEDGEDIFVGTLHGINEGIYISAEGEYINHPQYDVQFKFTSCEIKMPDDMLSIEKYLGSGVIKGVGEALAKRIVKKFKTDSFRIIEDEPERLAEVKGISPRMARNIAVSYNEKKEIQDSIIFLTGYGISVNLAVKIYNEYGNKLYEVIRTNPYKIAEDISGIGFKTADEIAEKMGVGRDSEFRIRAALVYVLSESNRLGHMYLPKNMLIRKTVSLLSENEMIFDEEQEQAVESQIVELVMSSKLVAKHTAEDEINVYASANYYNELNTARMLNDLNIAFDSKYELLQKNIKKIQEKENIEMDETQNEAVIQAVTHGVAVITGGPGTGKTTTINMLIKIFEMGGKEIMLGAPTGRAAKRITEATGYNAQTIHRMLELTGGVEDGEDAVYRFGRNASNPLETDVIIVDEMSMVDSHIFYSLLQAIIPGTHLILVGDSNQLPSVGPGNILKDIISSGVFSVTTLSRIFRQGEGSDIITNAHRINKGEHLEISNKSKDFFYIPRKNPQDIISEINTLITHKLPNFFGIQTMDIQVMTPMRKYELGVENLNKRLQQVQNPGGRGKPEKERGDVTFREGDKVMQIRNNYKLEWKIMSQDERFVKEEGIGVFNGDMGFIRKINDFEQLIEVVLDDGRVVEYGYGQLDELEHAYAITIHKSQGSEYPVVILPLFNGPARLMSRNLLYTAVTRAKKGVVIVGNVNMVELMIDNADEQKRYTTLDLRLRELKGEMIFE